MSEVKGYEELKVALDNIVREVSDPKFVDNAGNFVRSQAALLAPKDTGYLQQNIFYEREATDDGARGVVYTDIEYSIFVEMGTGPKGAANHNGISPNANPVYRMTPWMIPASEVDAATAEKYHWTKVYDKSGGPAVGGEDRAVIGYICYGQPAQPYMYPALHENEDIVVDMLDGKLGDLIG